MAQWSIRDDALYLDGKKVCELYTVGKNAHLIADSEDALYCVSFRDTGMWDAYPDSDGKYLDVDNMRLSPGWVEAKPEWRTPTVDGKKTRRLTPEEVNHYAGPKRIVDAETLYVIQPHCQDCPQHNKGCECNHRIVCLGAGGICLIPIDIYKCKSG